LVGPQGSFEETLTPIGATVAPTASAGAVLALARASSLEGRRALVDGLVQQDRLYAILAKASPADRRALAAIARQVAPPDPTARENAAVEQALRRPRRRTEYDIIIVTGFTPTDAPRLHAIDPKAKKRCARAADDWRHGKADFILATGGAVHPESTPVIEALELKAELLRLGVPADRIAIEPHAHHSTTNVRNAGRFMLAHGMRRGLIVSSFGQSFYFSNPDLSTFNGRCRKELGYEVGQLEYVDLFRTSFVPSPNCRIVNPDDPFDP
jgi:hypothetical protein